MRYRIRKSLKKLHAACICGVATLLYMFCRFVFVEGWDWQNPVAALPRVLPIIALTFVLMLVGDATTKIELEVQ